MKEKAKQKIIKKFNKWDKQNVKYRHYYSCFYLGLIVGFLMIYLFGMWILENKANEILNRPVIKNFQLDYVSVVIKEGNDSVNFTLENLNISYDITQLNKLILEIFTEEEPAFNDFIKPEMEVPNVLSLMKNNERRVK